MDEKSRSENTSAWLAQSSETTPILTFDALESRALRRILGLSALPSVGLFDGEGTLVELFEGEPPVGYLVRRAMKIAKEPI
ncbi:MAG: hypothetical protein ACPGQS_07305 [Bradymonadia bacterium]